MARVRPRLDPRPGHEGLVKLVADADRGVLVGATVGRRRRRRGARAAGAAVHAEVPVGTLRTMHFAYPTFHRDRCVGRRWSSWPLTADVPGAAA